MVARNHEYRLVRFSAGTVRKAVCAFREMIDRQGEKVFDEELKASLADGEWSFDSDDEFYASLLHARGFTMHLLSASYRIHLMQVERIAILSVRAKTRGQVMELCAPFDEARERETVPAPKEEAVVFIGHGRSNAWMFLRDHLRDQHGLRIECYEAGNRAGHTIRDILGSMIEKSSIALLVMTAEDAQGDGKMRARQNVVHEAGLFQGRLGWSRAIILLEKGVEQFSNVQGIQYIEFTKDNIRETFGDVLGAIRREFNS